MSRTIVLGLRSGLMEQGVQNYFLSQSNRCVSMQRSHDEMKMDVFITDDLLLGQKFMLQDVPIVLCKDFCSRSDVLAALRKGVKSCISIWSNYKHLDLAIDSACLGRPYVCPVVSEVICQSVGLANHDLTARELDVMECISSGFSSKQIARKLDVSPSTVETHRRNIMQKIGAHKVAEVTRYAIKRRSEIEANTKHKE